MRMRSVAAILLALGSMSLLAGPVVKVEKPPASAPAMSRPAPDVADATRPAEAMARNLIRNGDFEANQPGNTLDFWQPTPPYPATYRLIEDAARAHSGKRFLRLTPTKPDTDGNMYQFIAKVDGARRYVGSFWARGRGASIRLFFYRYGPDLKYLEARHSQLQKLTDQWQEVRLEYQMEPEVKNLACAVHVLGAAADIDDIEVKSLDKQPPELAAPKEKPWRGNKLGLGRDVPVPFTPLKVAGDGTSGFQIACWGRQWRFGSGLFPAQILSQDQPLLAGPIKLLVTVDGKSLDMGTAAVRVTAEHPDVVTLDATTSPAGSLRVTTHTTIEFDGMARIELTVQATQPVSLDALAVEIPLQAEQSSLYCRRAGRSNNESGAAPAAANWAFSPTIWFGNHQRGLCWFAESPAGWVNADRGKAIQWLPDGKSRTLRINLIDTSVRLEGARSFTFGLLPTPCKRPTGKAEDQYVRGGPCNPRYTRVLYLQNDDLAGDPLRYHQTLKQDAGARRLIAEAKDGQRAVAWVQLELVRSIPGYEQYFADWQRVPGETYPPDLVFLCPRSDWSDVLLYALAELQQAYKLDGFYFDTGMLEECANRKHGCGCEQNGDTMPSYPIFAIHEFKKRLYRMLVERLGPEKAYISSLINGHMDFPCLTFDTAAISGEELAGLVKDDYATGMTPEQFAVKFDPNLLGFWHIWLPVMNASHSRATTDTLLNLALLHNTPLWSEFLDRARLNSVMDALAAFKTRDCRFLYP